jgi:hypothetical protein
MKAKFTVFFSAIAISATVYAGEICCVLAELCCAGSPPCC